MSVPNVPSQTEKDIYPTSTRVSDAVPQGMGSTWLREAQRKKTITLRLKGQSCGSEQSAAMTSSLHTPHSQ